MQLSGQDNILNCHKKPSLSVTDMEGKLKLHKSIQYTNKIKITKNLKHSLINHKLKCRK